MGWIALYKDGKTVREEDGVGRPMQDGQDGLLRAIAQIDYHRGVAVDLEIGQLYLGFSSITINEETKELVFVDGPLVTLQVCEGETNIVGDYKHLTQVFNPVLDEQGNPTVKENGETIVTRTDFLDPLVWRPIWFRRTTGTPDGVTVVPVIGLQTTTPDIQGGRNVKKIISIFPDGRVGIE